MSQTTTPSPDSGPRVTREAMRDISTLRRAKADRMVAGVAEGISRHFDIDPIIVRVLFGALTLFGGAGLCIYVILWMTVPEEGNRDSGISSLLRRDPSRVMVAGVSIAAVLGALAMLTTIGWSSPNPFPIVTVGVVVILLIAVFSRRGDRPPPPPPPPPGTAPYAGPSAAPFSTTAPSPSAASGTAPVAPGPDVAASDTETDAATSADALGGTEAPPTDPAAAEPPAWWQRPRPSGGAPTPPGGSRPTSYAPIPPPPPPPPKPPRSHLFALTMATIAIAMGVVWLLDDAVYDDLPASTYPGVALGVIAAALIVSTWFGRSRLLIFVGLLAAFATAVSTIVGTGHIGERSYRPDTVAELGSSYSNGVGRLELDLTQLTDRENLDHQTVSVDQRIGELAVVVPSSISVQVDADVEFGHIQGPADAVIDSSDEGASVVLSSAPSGQRPDLFLDLDLKFGEIRIVQAECLGPSIPRRPLYELATTEIQGARNVPACN